MSHWREHKRQMRRDVHREMSVPALLLLARGGTPHPVFIRGPHTKRPLTVGDLAGGGEGWAERVETQPRLLFWISQLPFALRKGCIVSVEPGEAYRIEVADKPDGLTIYANVVELSAAEAAGLPVPVVGAHDD